MSMKFKSKMLSRGFITILLAITMIFGIIPGTINQSDALVMPSGSTNLATGMGAEFIPAAWSVGATGNYNSGTGVLTATTISEAINAGHIMFNTLGVLDEHKGGDGYNYTDTYVYSAKVSINDPSNDIGLFFRGWNRQWADMFCMNADNTVGIYYNNVSNGSSEERALVASTSFNREYNRQYEVTIKSWPDKVSVWIDGQIVFDQVSIDGAKPVLPGVWLRNSTLTVQGIQIFLDAASSASAGARQSPVKPVNSANLALSMTTDINPGLTASYVDGVLTNTANGQTGFAAFNNVPLANADTYVLSSDITFSPTAENWQAPRFVFRYANGEWLYCIGFINNEVLVMHEGYFDNVLGWQVLKTAPFAWENGRKYAVDIKSSPTDVSVWIDGKIVFYNVPVETYPAKTAVLFSNGSGSVENIKIYKTNDLFMNNDVSSSKVLSNVTPGSTLTQFLDATTIRANTVFKLINADTTTVLGNNSLVGTGTSVEIYAGGVLADTYSILIYGDVTGDGNINVADLSAMKLHMLGGTQIAAKFMPATDIYKTSESKLSISDLLGVKKQILNLKTISQQ